MDLPICFASGLKGTQYRWLRTQIPQESCLAIIGPVDGRVPQRDWYHREIAEDIYTKFCAIDPLWDSRTWTVRYTYSDDALERLSRDRSIGPEYRHYQTFCANVVRFSKKYGSLGPGIALADDSVWELKKESDFDWVESYRDWAREVGLMRMALTILKYVQSQDIHALSQYFFVLGPCGNDAKWVEFLSTPRRQDRRGTLYPNLSAPFDEKYGRTRLELDDFLLGDPVDYKCVGLAWLHWLVNEKVSGVRVKLLYGKRSFIEPHLCPGSLVDMLWLQLAVLLLDRRTLQKCRHCSVPFEAKRPNRAKFCSDRCRVSSYRASRSSALG